MNKIIDLNADVGESSVSGPTGNDAELIPFLTSASIACGFHAGDPLTIEKTTALAVQHLVAIGAHPSLPDTEGFGRRRMNISGEDACRLVLYQSGAIRAFAEAQGEILHHVKLHGALYNMAAESEELSKGIVQAIRKLGGEPVLYVPSGSVMEHIAANEGIRIAREIFADRRYLASGHLAPRHQPHALINDPSESVRQVLSIILNQKCSAMGGETITLQADTVCIHGDHPGCVTLAKQLRRALQEAGIRVSAFQ